MKDPERRRRILALRAERPRSRLVRLSALALLALALYSWSSGDVAVRDLFLPRRMANLERFLTRAASPHVLVEEGFSWGGLLRWLEERFAQHGGQAALATLEIGVLAIVLAGLLALALAPLGARTLMRPDPFLLGEGGERSPGAWGWFASFVRLVFVLLRAIPEYIWAFLLLGMLGASAWPAVLALTIHNAGILARLASETVENLDAAPLRSLRMLGARRRDLVHFAVFPLALPRFLLYFFYRFETCVREATVLGMLGVVSLGYWIVDARSRLRYDEMLFLVALGAGLVLAADLISYAARAWVRRAR